ncbi:MAG: diguanylate cyclase [Actinomycetota bacterium]|nr:diguanylate cyclase [Actinomycetota bacterium]
MYVDLDHFKSINDALGYAAGDELLILVAERIRMCLRAKDTVARHGGDEFVVLTEDSDETDAARVADRIVEELGRPFALQGHDIVVRASIGICVSQGSDTATDLLRNADLAMYASKSRGNGLFDFFEPAMHIHAVERLELEAELRRAVSVTLIDVLKIDRSFVGELDGSDAAGELIEAIVSLADALGFSTIAEGIERPEQRDSLARLGGGFGQGFYFSRPLDDAAILALLTKSVATLEDAAERG